MTAGNKRMVVSPPGATYLIKFFILGNVSLCCGLLVYYGLPPLISAYIDQQIALSPGSQSYPLWEQVPVPVYQRFYFFNVTNAQAIEQWGHKPQLEEVGPFTYRSEWSKRDIELDSGKQSINFKHYKQWQFEPSMSVADEQLQLTTINAPLAITLTLIQSAPNAVRLLVTFSLDGLSEGFFTKRSVKQLLFDGYPDLLTTFGPLLNAEMLSQGGHFGYMNARNNSLDGQYEINTGVDDISKLNTINKFNGRQELTYWNKHHGHCNSLAGATTGEMFPPLEANQSSVRLFQPDFCRVWPLELESELEHPSGLRLKRFTATRDVFRNATDLPENSCYFSSRANRHSSSTGGHNQANTNRIPSTAAQTAAAANGRPQSAHAATNSASGNNHHPTNGAHSAGRVRHEWPAGVFTLAPCKFHAPIYISMPHFLDADPHFGQQVDGLAPDRAAHEFYLDLEPRTGSPVTLSARVQLNVAISKPPGLVRFRHVPEIMFPVFWQELSVNVTGPVLDQLLLASRQSVEAPERIAYSFLLLGAAILITTAVFYLNLVLATSSVELKVASKSAEPAQATTNSNLDVITSNNQ